MEKSMHMGKEQHESLEINQKSKTIERFYEI